MSAALLLFGLYTLFAVVCALWAAATAAVRVREHGATHRAWTFLASTLTPPLTAGVALVDVLALPYLRPLVAALPVLVIAGTWSSVMTLRDQGLLLKGLHLPVFTLNVLLAGIYGVRAVQELLGEDLGLIGSAATATHAQLQTWIGHPSADQNPLWLHLPILLPLCLRFRWPHHLLLAIAASIASIVLAVFATVAPFAFQKADSFRRPIEGPILVPAGLTFGVKVPWADRRFDEETLLRWRRDLLALGIDHVTVEVAPETFEDEPLLRQVLDEIRWARDLGLRLVVVAAPPLQFRLVPARDLRELAAAIGKGQWLAAERLRPDLLVLFSGPFGQLRPLAVRNATLPEWLETIRDSAAAVRQANPSVQVAVSVESRGPHSAELFRHLKAADSPVDVVGLSIFPGDRTLPEVEQTYAGLANWCARTPGDRPVRVFEAGASPYSCGGELGQWHFLAALLLHAHRFRGLTAISIDSLTDREAAVGLTTADGRRRRAWRELAALLPVRGSPPR
jgi:hypothetical protein